MVGCTSDGPTRDRVMRLIAEKDRIENEIRNHTMVLETNNIGMHEPLVDLEGFPRADIDVYRVRHCRHQIICLQNDHKTIMKGIERGLAEVHSEYKGSSEQHPSTANGDRCLPYTNGYTQSRSNDQNGDSENAPGFATVGLVSAGSPADIAGLQRGDEILQFGSIHRTNFTDMTQFNDIVTHSVNQSISVKIRRGGNINIISLVPRPWSQPGLLGCHIQRSLS